MVRIIPRGLLRPDSTKVADLSNEVVLDECHVNVRQRQVLPGATWRGWHPRLGGGPVLRIRSGSVEIQAPQGTMLETRHLVFSADAITMKYGQVGRWGLPFGRQDECIFLTGRDVDGWRRRIAVSSDGLPAVWTTLADAGVRERDEGSPQDD